MKHLLTILLALTCASAWGQSVSMPGVGASERGVGIEATVGSVLTNLVVTGELNYPATGTYINVGDFAGYDSWTNSDEFFIRASGVPKKYYIGKDGLSDTLWANTNLAPIVVGTFVPDAGGITGNAYAVYFYQTNIIPASVSVSGQAIP